MSKIVERKMCQCKKCNQITTHYRNNTSMGLMGLLVHIVLIVMTAGAWLILLIIYKMLKFKVGGWKCESCTVSLYDKLNNIKLW